MHLLLLAALFRTPAWQPMIAYCKHQILPYMTSFCNGKPGKLAVTSSQARLLNGV